MSPNNSLTPAGAARAIEDGGSVAFVIERERIVASGPDAAGYLQGQLSQQIERMPVGQTAWSLLLQPQGKVDAWMRVHRLADQEFWLDLDTGAGAAALARLERFKLRTDAELTLESVTALALRGPGAVEVAARATDAVALEAAWDGLAGVDLMGADPEGLAADLDVDIVADPADGPERFGETLRVWQGRPAMGAELDDSTIPAAAGIVELSVDFTKGCYVGQELVARVDSRGNNTPTNLHRLDAPAGSALLAGQELFTIEANGSVGESAGRVTSAAVWPADQRLVGLGYLKRSISAPVELVTSDGVPVTVRS